jgi:hypothetical protein
LAHRSGAVPFNSRRPVKPESGVLKPLPRHWTPAFVHCCLEQIYARHFIAAVPATLPAVIPAKVGIHLDPASRITGSRFRGNDDKVAARTANLFRTAAGFRRDDGLSGLT